MCLPRCSPAVIRYNLLQARECLTGSCPALHPPRHPLLVLILFLSSSRCKNTCHDVVQCSSSITSFRHERACQNVAQSSSIDNVLCSSLHLSLAHPLAHLPAASSYCPLAGPSAVLPFCSEPGVNIFGRTRSYCS